MRDFLTKMGFDVVEVGNAKFWNYDKTIVVGRTDNLLVAKDLARVLQTSSLIQLIDSSRMVEATVYIGKDFYSLIPKWKTPQ